jgi:hypothetical protein
MASIEIGQLPLTTTVVSTTQIPVENANVTQKIEASAIRDFVSVGLSSLSVTGNISATNFTTSGSYFGPLSPPTQQGITQVGTLINLNSSGNIAGANLTTAGNVQSLFFLGNGSLLTGLPEGYTNTNTAAYLPTHTGNISAGNLTISNTLVASGNTRVGQQLYVVGQSVLESTTRVHGNLVAAVETLSTSPTTGALVVAGVGGLGVGGNIHVGGNLNAVRSYLTTSNIVTANVQTITTNSLATNSLLVSGNIVSDNVSGTKSTFTQFQGSGALLTNIPNAALNNSAITINGTAVSLGNNINLNVGVVSITGTANQIAGNVTQGNILLSLPQSIGTTNNVQFGSFGVGTAASGTTGEIRATNNITAYFSSDARYKENIRAIPDATEKVLAIGGKLFDWNDAYIQQHGGTDDYFVRKQDFGVIAQDVHAVLPEAVRTRENGMLAVDYEKLCALAFQAIVELKSEIEQLKSGQKP